MIMIMIIMMIMMMIQAGEAAGLPLCYEDCVAIK